MKQFLLIFLFSIQACINKPKPQISFPKLILGTCDTIISVNSNKMLVSVPSMYGLNIIDSLEFNDTRKYQSSSFPEDYHSENFNSNDSLLVFVDTLNIHFHSAEMGFYTFPPPPPPPPPPMNDEDSNKYDVFVKERTEFLRKRKREHYKSFPLYIYNSKKSNVVVQKPIDGDLFFIIEAKDRHQVWRPIEYWEQRTFLCGTGHYDYSLKPKHFIVSAVKRYRGSFKTKLRVKFLSFKKVFYSNEYSGYINESQFDSTEVLKNIKLKFSHWEKTEIEKRISRSFLNSTN